MSQYSPNNRWLQCHRDCLLRRSRWLLAPFMLTQQHKRYSSDATNNIMSLLLVLALTGVSGQPVVHCITFIELYCLVLHTWCSILGAPYLVLHTWCSILGAPYLVLHTWCSILGAPYLVLHTWCSILGAPYLVLHTQFNVCTIEPRFTVTLVTEPPHQYGHPGRIPNYFHKSNVLDISPVNTVTSLFRSLWSSPVGDLNIEVRLYLTHCTAHELDQMCIVYHSPVFNCLPNELEKKMPT